MVMRTNRVVVLLNDDEMQKLLNKACAVPLSIWIRNLILKDDKKKVSR